MALKKSDDKLGSTPTDIDVTNVNCEFNNSRFKVAQENNIKKTTK